MATRSYIGVNLMNIAVLSTAATSTQSAASTDFGPYFNVGRREVKFLVQMGLSLSTSTAGVTISILQGSSAATANSTVAYTTIPGGDGSSASFSSTLATSGLYTVEWNGLVSSRYVQARVVGTSSTDVGSYVCSVWALPMGRNV